MITVTNDSLVKYQDSVVTQLRQIADEIEARGLATEPHLYLSRYNPVTGVKNGFIQRDAGKFYTLFVQWEYE